jgi:hypothetical protein
MLHDWRRRVARDRSPGARADELLRGWIGPSRLDRACAAYVAKTKQTFALRDRLGARMAIVDYDDLVSHRGVLLPQLCEFADVPYDCELARLLRGKSAHRKHRLAEWEAEYVSRSCAEAYGRALDLRTIGRDEPSGLADSRALLRSEI